MIRAFARDRPCDERRAIHIPNHCYDPAVRTRPCLGTAGDVHEGSSGQVLQGVIVASEDHIPSSFLLGIECNIAQVSCCMPHFLLKQKCYTFGIHVSPTSQCIRQTLFPGASIGDIFVRAQCTCSTDGAFSGICCLIIHIHTIV